MKEILLTRGAVAIVDDDDFEYLNQFKWYCSKFGYACRDVVEGGAKKHVWMHRVVAKTPENKSTDHINGIRLDNRKENLRHCTMIENMRNRGKQNNNTSGYKGVFWSIRAKRWRAQIVVKRKAIHLGLFDTPEDASVAYKEAEKKYFEDFARSQ